MDDDRAHPDPNASCFPVEVCENIINMLYSVAIVDRVEDTRALHHCTLVCRAWRVRSQCNLFYVVVLHNLPALQKFSAVLDNAPHLCDYVHEVTLVGRALHTATSPLSLLSIALRGKLPKLQEVTINRFREDAKSYPRTSKSDTVKPLQYLPLHPRFAVYFSAFTTVSRLCIVNLTFVHFNDLARMINSLPALRTLVCSHVRCVALGALPFNMKPQADGIHAPATPFAPKLQKLRLYCVDIHCFQRLVSACGPRLRELSVTVPFFHDAEMVLPGVRPHCRAYSGVDLSLCTTLKRLDIWLGPELMTDGQSLDKLKAMLDSRDSKVPLQYVHLQPYYEQDFTWQGFADLAGTVGRVLEELFHESSAPPSADGEVGEQGGRWRIWVDVYDWEVWRHWWWTHVQKCFPSFAKSNGLTMTCRRIAQSLSCIPLALNNLYNWKDRDALPPMPTTTT
ncbi:hypothetical protein BD311DRAFT_783035 [Dichomitus squalens]|uniref:F-box domain-containing protein n=1 Tax=Dichomitus squalens TaxID=114155 RepID=A0A4Q9M327_9APHY|nr:hypothetical protein BD311DRAFT_783035 [Dichomitus squalens]